VRSLLSAATILATLLLAAPAAAQQSADTAAASRAAAPAGSINVRSFGAKGNGRADDAPEIRAAVEAARRAGGKTVYLPPGTYLLRSGRVQGGVYSHIVLEPDCPIVGAGMGKTVLVAGRTNCHAFGAFGKSRLAVSRLTIRKQPNRGLTGQDAAKIAVCNDVRFTRVETRGLFQGPQFYGCTNVVASKCVSRSCELSGLGAVDLSNHVETWTGTDGILFQNCRVTGTKRAHYGIRVLGLSRARPARNVRLEACVTNGNRGAGTYLKCVVGARLDSCKSENNGQDGFTLLGSTDCEVSGCTALDNNASRSKYGYVGISVGRSPELVGPTERTRVHDNRCGNSERRPTQAFGYYEFNGTKNSTVFRNDFRDNAIGAARYRSGTVHYGNRPSG
jgi:parallel beta-helix repeat protein